MLEFGQAHSRLLTRGALAVLVVQMGVVMVMLAFGDAPTYDEPDHFGAAVEWTQYGDLRWSPDAPPLSGLLAGLPFRFIHVHVPVADQAIPDFYAQTVGQDILYRAGNNGQHLIEIARMPMIAFTLLVVLVVFFFGRLLWGTAGGLLAAAVASLDPTLIAHGHLVTTDMPLAGFMLAASWLLYLAHMASGRRSFWLLFAAAACVGGALASKFTALPVVPAYMLLAAVPALRSGPLLQRLVRGVGRAALLAVVAISVVWLVYLMVDPSLSYTRVSSAPSGTKGLLVSIAQHVPFPAPFRDGLATQIALDAAKRDAFLLGHRYLGGRVNYFPLLLLIKTPLATLALMLLGLFMVMRRRSKESLKRLLFLLAAPLTGLVFAMASNTNLGIRHILYIPLFGAVLCGAAAVQPLRLRRIVAVGYLVVFLAVSSLIAYPSDLAYVNEAFGSGSHGYRQLSDSNIDWGQDLIRAKPALAKLARTQPVWLAYFGTVPPSAYGIKARAPDPNNLQELRGGILAISVSLINTWQPGTYDAILTGLTPFAQIGHSILLYRIPT